MKTLFARIDALVNRLVKNYTLWIFIGLLVLFAVSVKAYHILFPAMPQPAVYAFQHFSDQGWTLNQREKFYQTGQGNLVAPFDWFMSVERQPQGFPPYLGPVDLFSKPSIQARYGLLPDTSVYNPELLPVGIVKDIVDDRYVATLGQGHKEWISISCAACHVGQIMYHGRALRIDGGQSMWNFSQWSADMVENLMLTATLPGRFARFAKRVLARDGLPDTPENRAALRASMKAYFAKPLVMDALNAMLNHTYPTIEGNTRTAALGRGVNGEFGVLDQRNIETNRGPVSFPPLWNTHYFDWVQSTSDILQPMGRNVTEAWGVNVQVELTDPARRYESTARMRDMYWMETVLSVLKPPPWPEPLFGRIDRQKAERGRYLFAEAVWDKALPPAEEQLAADPNPQAWIEGPNPQRPQTGYCARCHAPVRQTQPDRYGNRYVQLPLYRLDFIATDPNDAVAFAARNPYTGVMAGEFGGKTQVGIGTALKTTITGVTTKWYDEHQVPARCREIMNGLRDNEFRAPLAYPARPLAGYWATGPFLHNGSVRTLYQLLGPAIERETKFWMGTLDFDPVKIGFENHRVDGAFLYDTTIEGNLNAGHEFRDAPRGTKGVVGPALSADDRMAIIEYMKVLQDDIADPKDVLLRKTLLASMQKDYEAKGYEEAGLPMGDFCRQLETLFGQQAVAAAPGAPYGAAPAPH